MVKDEIAAVVFFACSANGAGLPHKDLGAKCYNILKNNLTSWGEKIMNLQIWLANEVDIPNVHKLMLEAKRILYIFQEYL